MQDLQGVVNKYLFHEFGVKGDESQITDSWPFELRHIGQTRDLTVFEFEHDQAYFALAGHSMTFMPTAGMTFDDLLLQVSGSSWVNARDPVDLATSRPDDASVPSTLDRRRALEILGAHVLTGQDPILLEGLFLRTEGKYLGLFRAPGRESAVVAGLSGASVSVSFPTASPWRRLAWGVGRWLQRRAQT